jgi:hypothetical protein
MFDSYVAAGIEGEEGAFQELAVVERADTSAGVHRAHAAGLVKYLGT